MAGPIRVIVHPPSPSGGRRVRVDGEILGLAHNADFETIEDEDLRARCEAKALKFGRHICVNRQRIHGLDEINALAIRFEKGSVA